MDATPTAQDGGVPPSQASWRVLFRAVANLLWGVGTGWIAWSSRLVAWNGRLFDTRPTLAGALLILALALIAMEWLARSRGEARAARVAQRQILNSFGLLLLGLLVGYTTHTIWARGLPLFANILFDGIALGAMYALVALGYTMVYGIIELINFAHGDVFGLGAVIGLTLLPVFGLGSGNHMGWLMVLPLLAVFLITMVICGGVNVAIERFAYRPLRNAPRLAPLITAIGMSAILEGFMNLWKGPINLNYPTNLLPADVHVQNLIIIGSALLLAIALTLFINLSRLGKAMRATAQDRDAAQLMGIDINQTISTTFFIGAMLAGAGGIIYGLYIHTFDFQVGFILGLYAFTSAVFGGIGNIPGAALGGLLIGLIRAINNTYFDSSWTDTMIFAILILTLVFRPTGLLGMRVPEK